MPKCLKLGRRRLALGAAVIALSSEAAFAQAPMEQPPAPGAVAAPTDPSRGSDAVGPQVGAPADRPTTGGSDARNDEIVVTGTLIRGIAPVGANVIGVTAQQVQATGASTTNQVLATIPQVGNYFNTLPNGPSAVVGSNTTNSISRPNLRNLPAANTAGGAQTLVLIDGHRVTAAGTGALAVDPDIIAPGAIERVEALTDGGSAIYGSDALGGVINFIMRRRFDGLEADVRYGIADDVRTIDGSFTAGKDWGSGSAFIAYGYEHNDALFGSDRKFIRQIDYNTGLPTGRNCATPTATIGTTTYVPSGAGVVAGAPSTCDASDATAVYPRSTHHNVFGRLTQTVNDWLSFDISGLYSHRLTLANNGVFGGGTNTSSNAATVTLAPTNPNYRNPGGAQAGLAETVRFDYSPVLGAHSLPYRTVLDTYNITPSATANLGGGFQLRVLGTYGRSKVTYDNVTLNATAQTAAAANGTLNPFNIAAINPTVLAGLIADNHGYGLNKYQDYRAVIDGPLFSLPGGDVRAAIGGEYSHDHFYRAQTNTTTFAPLATVGYVQSVKSAFGEVQVPIVSSQNGSPGLRELSFSASARYDDYNDFGHTFNPKLAASYKPVEWITLKGNWGKSFTAPSPVDQIGALTATAGLVPSQFLVAPPGNTFTAAEQGVFLGNGAISDLGPQKANSWSIGTVIAPPVVEGLTLSATYYTINLKGTIGRPIGLSPLPFYANFPSLFAVRPSGQQLAAFLQSIAPGNVGFTLVNPTSSAQALVQAAGGGTVSPVGIVLDTLVRNLGKTKLTGIDFGANYVMRTSFGSIDASVTGNQRLKQDTRVSPLAALTHDLDVDTPKLRLSTTLGTTIDAFRAQVTVNHSSPFDRSGGAALVSNFGQGRVKAFNLVDLFFKYDVKASGLLNDLSLTLTVRNLFDTDPPLVKSTTLAGFSPDVGFTLGRMFQIGVKKNF